MPDGAARAEQRLRGSPAIGEGGEDEVREMAQALRRAIMEDGDGSADAAPVATPCLAERLHAFRSLGGNCEFGFVQRYGGAEPSGLLRFSYTPIDDLIHALDTDFAEYGVPGDLVIDPAEHTYYYCRSRRYNIWSNTSHRIDAITPEALLEREYGRVAHLKLKMLAELAAGSKILVRKVSQGETDGDFERLAQAIRRHGPSTLLRVTEAGPDWQPGPVRRLSERMLEGSVRRFAPTEQAWDIDLEPWLGLCDGAYAARYGVPETALDAGPHAQATHLQARLRRHRGRHREAKLSTFTKIFAPAGFDPERIHTFSTWVWIPRDFTGSRIFAIAGRERLGYGDADLSRRECWQRVWVAGRLTPEHLGSRIGLASVGTRKDSFWSYGAQLHAGPVPRAAEPPTVTVRPSLLRRLTGWYG